MSIKNIFKHGLALAVAAGTTCTFLACSDDSSSNTEQPEYGYIPSSASISNRGDIDYKDTIILNKKLDLNIELLKNDTIELDSSEIYVDSFATTIPMYLGELTRGSRIRVKASVSNITEDRIRIRNERGEKLKALTAVARDSSHQDSLFKDYMIPSLGTKSDSTYRDSNQFVVFSPNHYYLEIGGNFTDESTVRIFVQIDTNYYNYTYTNSEDAKSISMEMNDTIRGIVPMDDNTPDTIKIDFSSSEGYSLNLTTSGTNVSNIRLVEEDSTLLGENSSMIDTMLISNDSVNWTLKISPETFSNYSSGDFAFFNAITRSRELEKGEYFKFPDSIKYPGEEHVATRPKDLPEEAIYRYNLRQEQFVWLGDYKKGDSLVIKHGISNYSDDNFKSPVSYKILNKDKDSLGTISSTYGGSFKIPEDGPYYLHYLRLNSEPKDRVADSLRYVLQLKTMIQQPGLLKSMQFRDKAKDAEITKITPHAGDTIRFNKYDFAFTPIEQTSWKVIGSEVDLYIPCESLDFINRDGIYSCSGDSKEQLISSDYLVIQEAGVGETAELIAQSKADPTMRDTLKIQILAKATN